MPCPKNTGSHLKSNTEAQQVYVVDVRPPFNTSKYKQCYSTHAYAEGPSKRQTKHIYMCQSAQQKGIPLHKTSAFLYADGGGFAYSYKLKPSSAQYATCITKPRGEKTKREAQTKNATPATPKRTIHISTPIVVGFAYHIKKNTAPLPLPRLAVSNHKRQQTAVKAARGGGRGVDPSDACHTKHGYTAVNGTSEQALLWGAPARTRRTT